MAALACFSVLGCAAAAAFSCLEWFFLEGKLAGPARVRLGEGQYRRELLFGEQGEYAPTGGQYPVPPTRRESS